VSDPAVLPVAKAADRGAKAFDVGFRVRELSPAKAAAALDKGDVDAVLTARGLTSKEAPDEELTGIVQTAAREVRQAEALDRAGLSGAEVQRALNPPPLRVATTEAVDPERDRKGSFAFIAVLALYTQLLTFGYLLASGVVEEKASRVVEVLLAKAGPRPLLAGKILGIGAVALAQLVVFVAVGLGLAAAVGTVDIPSGTGRLAVELVAWFLLGFAVYACVFAMSGAIASRVEELQTSTGPIALAAMGGFFAAIAAAENPDGPVAQVATFVPVAAPMVLPVRSAAGALPAWEAAVAVALVVATAVIVVRLAARVYAGGALFTRGPLKLREALARGRD
jgi:ABC-2 type transport system permease protein